MVVNAFGFVSDKKVVGRTVEMVEMKDIGQMMREYTLRKSVPEIGYKFVVDMETVLVVAVLVVDDTEVLDSTEVLDISYSY